MSRGGRPPLEDVRKHFEKVTKVDGRGRKTPRQKCNYCENDIVDLIDRLKKHLMKCKSFPEDLKGSLSFIMSKNQTSISDSTNPEEQPLDKMDADKKLARLIHLFESDTSLLSGVYNEWQNLSNSVNMQKLDLDFKMKVYDLINQWFKYASHPAMAIANLLDPNFCGKSLEPDDFEKIILPYLGKVYTFENAAHIYGVMQKYIAKTDEFSGALLWASAKYSSPIGWWKSNFTYKFPIVVELACRVLSIPTSSATAMHD
ncbi:hypothetical protein RhiirA5_375638 [Rhizophagus irregularis]|uniref:HAT C-terminal dimerisation domain-containing protein n=1 Tax=Rhizophagus irregularis TaxID=588596 RepID=A0A2N0PQW1_9GLOM|nr:hypothetical protein RhiirA5_375638 [Rhizophagus irregularis]